MKHKKGLMLVAALSLSVAGLDHLKIEEGFTTEAVIPVKGDVPTIGFGSTVYPDGTKVQMGDRIAPENALLIAKAHIAKDEQIFRKSLPGVYMSQVQYDMWMNFVYQFGTGNWMKSGMRKNLLAGNGVGACNYLLQYRFVKGYDCSTPGNKICMGVWTRQQKRHGDCMNALA